MKIGLDVNRVLSVYNNSAKSEKLKNNTQSAKDKVDISKVGRELSKYVELAKNSELTDKKVDEIKKLIAGNQYSVDSEKLAKNILEFMKDSDK
jgi:flagellar biosynthesis anti-sigma factor FlgM